MAKINLKNESKRAIYFSRENRGSRTRECLRLFFDRLSYSSIVTLDSKNECSPQKSLNYLYECLRRDSVSVVYIERNFKDKSGRFMNLCLISSRIWIVEDLENHRFFAFDLIANYRIESK